MLLLRNTSIFKDMEDLGRKQTLRIAIITKWICILFSFAFSNIRMFSFYIMKIQETLQ